MGEWGKRLVIDVPVIKPFVGASFGAMGDRLEDWMTEELDLQDEKFSFVRGDDIST